jgi:hypothetical protein
MQTKVLTHAKPASAPAASFTSIRSSVPQGNGSFMEPPVEQDFSRERLCQPAPSVSVASGSSPEDAANRAADTALARRPAPEYKPAPDTSTESSPSTAPAQLRVRIESIGAPLPTPTRKDMEQRFGHDFSRVRVATDREADSLARGLGAHAFTHGENIAFAAGEFALETARGRRLLAHELAHVIQQREMGRKEIALDQGKNTLLDDAEELAVQLANAKSAAERKPLVDKALKLGDSLTAALKAATGPNPPAGALSADDARSGLKKLGRALSSLGEADAGTQLAIKSQDTDVQQAIVNTLIGYGGGVAGQQRLLSHLAKLAGEKITPAGPKQTPGQWLDANTAAIGRTFAKLDKMGLQGLKTSSIALERSHVLLEEYFTHSPTDVTPEPTGKVAGLPVDTGTNQIEADCDVYATYAARLLREQGWDTAGYMSILPHEKKPSDPTVDRDAHAVALARRPAANNQNEYLGVSNSEFRNLGTFADDKSALPELLKLALDIYDPPLQKYGSYYLPGATGGGFDSRLLDPVNKGLTPYSSAP